jgi:hypothetical protein
MDEIDMINVFYLRTDALGSTPADMDGLAQSGITQNTFVILLYIYPIETGGESTDALNIRICR